jgi:hypothetical protein
VADEDPRLVPRLSRRCKARGKGEDVLEKVAVRKPDGQGVGGSIGKPANSNTPRVCLKPFEYIAERAINELNIRPVTAADDIPRVWAPRVRGQDEDSTLVGDTLQHRNDVTSETTSPVQHQNERHWPGEVMTRRNIQQTVTSLAKAELVQA